MTDGDNTVSLDLPDMVGSGQSVGGVISETVGGCGDPLRGPHASALAGSHHHHSSTTPYSGPLQLQRIVSRCNCELVFVSYGQNTLDSLMDRVQHMHGPDGQLGLDAVEMMIPPPPSDDVMDLWAQREQPVDSFTLTHYDLNICTNSVRSYAQLFGKCGTNSLKNVITNSCSTRCCWM